MGLKDKLKGKRQSKNIEDKRLVAIRGRPERPVSKNPTKYGPQDAADRERGERYLKDWETAKGYREPSKLAVESGYKSMGKDFPFFKHSVKGK